MVTVKGLSLSRMKTQESNQIETQIQQFRKAGGKIKKIKTGRSSIDPASQRVTNRKQQRNSTRVH